MKTYQKDNTYGAVLENGYLSEEVESSDTVSSQTRKRYPLIVGVAVALSLLANLSFNHSSNTEELPSTSWTSDQRMIESLAATDHAEAHVEEASSKKRYAHLTHTDFLAFDNVRSWLTDDIGIDPETEDTETLGNYLPLRVTVMYRLSLIYGEIGHSAAKGYVAFDLTNMNSTGSYTSSLFVIMDVRGVLKQVLPTFNVPGGATDMHFCGLKLKDPATFLLAGNSGTTEKGPTYTLDWKTGAFEKIGNNTWQNCHDVQWAYSGNEYWSPGSHKSIVRSYATNGSTSKFISLSQDAMDINHVELVEQDSIAIVSSRMTNAIVKLRTDTGNVEWIAGGTRGEFDMVKFSGEVLEPGASLFVGQHNAEYFGSDEYYMFDNQYNQGNASRMLIVKIDVAAGTVTENWEYKIKAYPWGYTPVYGDADRLPTGNILGSFWPSTQSGAEFQDITFDARIVEVDRASKDEAMQIDVYGTNNCSKHECERTNFVGWKVYSVERFYETPLVYGVHCSERHFSFKTQNIFKQNSEYAGSYTLYNKKRKTILATGGFTYNAHWRETTVYITMDRKISANAHVVLVVNNTWGNEASYDQTC